jgi:PKD repeat protein
MRFLLTFFITTLLLVGSYAQATEYTIEISWSVTPVEGVELAGFRLYDEQNNEVCDTSAETMTCTSEPEECTASMECAVDIEGTEATFTLASYATNGVESDHSAPFTIVFEEPVQLAAAFTFAKTENSLSVDFDASDSTGTINEYAWDFGDGGVESGLTANHTFASDGTYSVTLTVTDDQGTAQITQDVTVAPVTGTNQPPAVVFSVAPGNGYSPLDVTLDAGESSDPDGDSLTFSWDFGDGTTAEDAGPTLTHTYVVSATGSTVYYTATVTVADGQASSTTDQTIMVTNDGSSTGTPATAVIAPGTTGPAPITITFSAENSAPSEGATITDYNWNFGDGATATGETTSHLYTSNGSYTVTLTIADTAGTEATATYTIDVSANSLPQTKITPTLIQIYKLLLLNK